MTQIYILFLISNHLVMIFWNSYRGVINCYSKYYKHSNPNKNKRFARFEGVVNDVGEDGIGHFLEKNRELPRLVR